MHVGCLVFSKGVPPLSGESWKAFLDKSTETTSTFGRTRQVAIARVFAEPMPPALMTIPQLCL